MSIHSSKRSMSSDVRIGLVGAGWFGSIHLETWESVPGAKVVAVCDIDTRLREGASVDRTQDSFHQAAAIRKQKSRDYTFYSDLAEMLNREDLDVLDVVVPEAAHFAVVEVGLRAGLPVIVEKPFVTEAHQAVELCRLACEMGTNLYVGNILRFDPRQMALKETISASAHPIRHMSFQRHFQVSAQKVYGRIHPFFGACVHDIDLAIWFMGGPPVRVLAVTRSWNREQHPDVVVGLAEWQDGAYAVFQNAWHVAQSCPYGFEFETKVFLRDATCIIRNQPDLELWTAEGVRAPEFFFWNLAAGITSGALRNELSHFYECVRLGVPSDRIPSRDACAGIAVAEALVHSSETAEWELIGEAVSS